MAKVTVIVCTYNRPFYLPRALNSIEAQTYQDYQVVVVDDGSTPPAQVNQDDYKFPLYLERLDTNSGFHAKPKNYAISKYHTPYYAYLDDDDRYTPTHLEYLVSLIESGSYDFAYGSRAYCDTQDNFIGKFPWYDYTPETSGNQFWLGVPDILHTRKIIYQLGGWNEGLKRYGDYDLGVRLGKIKARGVGINEPITVCTQHDKTISKQNEDSPERIREEVPVIQEWLKKNRKF